MADKKNYSPLVDSELLRILACPSCHAPIAEAEGWLQCTNGECRRRYPVRSGIPIMLIDEAEILTPEHFSTLWAGKLKKSD